MEEQTAHDREQTEEEVVESPSVALCPCFEGGRNPGEVVSSVHNLVVEVHNLDQGGRELDCAAVWRGLVQIPHLLAAQVA